MNATQVTAEDERDADPQGILQGQPRVVLAIHRGSYADNHAVGFMLDSLVTFHRVWLIPGPFSMATPTYHICFIPMTNAVAKANRAADSFQVEDGGTVRFIVLEGDSDVRLVRLDCRMLQNPLCG